MQREKRESLADALIVWGFVLSLGGFLVAGCFEACKIVALIPAAFESTPASFHNPVYGSDDDYRPNRSGRSGSTARRR
jgi:hypothetical protein